MLPYKIVLSLSNSFLRNRSLSFLTCHCQEHPHGASPQAPRNHDLVQALVKALSRSSNASAVLVSAAVISKAIIHVEAVLKKYLKELIGGALFAGGIGALIPSLAVVIVNTVGFTSGGVAAGSIAAALQSAIYGPATGGMFSALQAFGATAAVASPAVLAVGITLAVGGAGLVAYAWWRGRQRQRIAESQPLEGGQLVRYQKPSAKGGFLIAVCKNVGKPSRACRTHKF